MNEKKRVVLVGDFNLKDVDWTTNTSNTNAGQILCDIAADHSIEQLVYQPTRETDSCKSISDLVFTNYADLVGTVKVMEGLDGSDHNSVAFTLSLPAKRAKCKRKEIFLYLKADLESLRTTLANVPWSIVMLVNEGIHTMWLKWKEVVFAVVRQHIPLKKIKCRPNNPWIMPEILRFVRKKRRLWKKAKELGTDAAWAKYREPSNCARHATRCNHQKYLQELGASLQTNPKHFWSYVRSS